MTQEHLSALLTEAGAAKRAEGWVELGERHLTLYLAQQGTSLTVSRIEALKQQEGLLWARTVKHEVYVVSLADVYAGAVDSPMQGTRKAGFV
jgi:hypothetical protein